MDPLPFNILSQHSPILEEKFWHPTFWQLLQESNESNTNLFPFPTPIIQYVFKLGVRHAFPKISYWSNVQYKTRRNMIKLRTEIGINSMAGFLQVGWRDQFCKLNVYITSSSQIVPAFYWLKRVFSFDQIPLTNNLLHLPFKCLVEYGTCKSLFPLCKFHQSVSTWISKIFVVWKACISVQYFDSLVTLDLLLIWHLECKC